jgi:hypothetical protein
MPQGCRCVVPHTPHPSEVCQLSPARPPATTFLQGIKEVLDRVCATPGGGSRPALWFNIREEPVLYINGRPFVLREEQRPLKNLQEYQGIDRWGAGPGGCADGAAGCAATLAGPHAALGCLPAAFRSASSRALLLAYLWPQLMPCSAPVLHAPACPLPPPHLHRVHAPALWLVSPPMLNPTLTSPHPASCRKRLENMEARLREDVLREAAAYGGRILVARETSADGLYGELCDAWEAVPDDSCVQTPAQVRCRCWLVQ